ncbi:MAG: hypothetical protein HY900_15415 [Deltaproteobacteria bacterium]|nr:hypothetical protein [Deltaproteobacteria bacterium]
MESLPAVLAGDSLHDLSPAEVDALREGGADFEDRDLGAKDPVARGVAELTAILETSLSTDEAARRLGVQQSRIRQRLTERTLYGIRRGNRWVLPTFQFAGDSTIPGIEVVIRSLAPDVHPVELVRWLTTPDPELHSESLGKDLSPLDWLRLGNSPERVAANARDL